MELIADFILVAGILLNILALVGLLRRGREKLPQRILIVFWVFILGILIYFYANLHELTTLAFWANYLEDGARFVIPPLIYVYIKSLVFNRQTDFIKMNWIHFTPFLIYLLLYTIPKSINSDYSHVRLIDTYVDWALVQDLFGIVYFLLSLALFYRISKTMKQAFSSVSEENLLWIERFLISFTAVLVIDLMITISEITFAYSVNWDGYITVFFLIMAMSYLGYYGLNQSIIFLPEFLIEDHIAKPISVQKKASNYLGEAEIKRLETQYFHAMEVDKAYLLPSLDLKALASMMGTSQRKVSALLNEVLEINFHDAVNGYRVEAAKRALQSEQIKSHSITGIGLSSGFSSKSSFYRIFKKHTSCSPSAYRKKHLK